jgi:hypothetical protein
MDAGLKAGATEVNERTGNVYENKGSPVPVPSSEGRRDDPQVGTAGKPRK